MMKNEGADQQLDPIWGKGGFLISAKDLSVIHLSVAGKKACHFSNQIGGGSSHKGNLACSHDWISKRR